MKPRAFPAFAGLSFSGPLFAAPLYWDGSAGSAFSNSENWSTDIAGNVNPDSLVPGINDVATFNANSLVAPSTAPQTVNLGGNISVFGLNYTNITEGSILELNDLGGASLVNGALMFIKYSGVWNLQRFTYGGNLINDNAQITVNGNQFQLDYDFVNGADKGVALIVVPEPASMMLAMAGLAGFAVRRQRANAA